MSSEHKALVRRWFDEVWTKGRAEAIDEMLGTNAVVHGLGSDMRPADFKAFHSAYRNAFPEITIQIDDIVAEGNMVAARWSGTGTHQGAGLGFAATGRTVHFTGMIFVRVERGKLVEGWNNFESTWTASTAGVVNLT